MARGPRRRIAHGIYEDRSGRAAVVRVRGVRREFRYPLAASVSEIRLDLETKIRALERTIPGLPARGTLADVVRRYLKAIPHRARRRDRRQLLQPWIDAHGRAVFFALTRSALQQTCDRWRHEGLSAARVNKRISALRVAWRTLAPDETQPHAIDRVTRYAAPLPVQRGLPMPVVDRILDAVTQERTRARLRVLAWTGQPPARVMQITPSHVRWDATPPLLYVVPRKKGAGSRDAWLPLLPQAQTALRELFRLKAHGPFEVSPAGRFLRDAVARVQQELRRARRHAEADQLQGFRLYDLRHSFLTAFGAATTDVYATAEYAGHASLQTTRRYMQGAALTRMRDGIAQLAAALTVPPDGATETRGNLPRRAGSSRMVKMREARKSEADRDRAKTRRNSGEP